MKKSLGSLLISSTLACWGLVASAQATSTSTGTEEDFAPVAQVAEAAYEVIKDAHGMGKLALSIAILNLLIMGLKTHAARGWFDRLGPGSKRLVLLALGQALGILSAIEGGMSPASAIIAGLLTSGGASALYEAAKPFLKGRDEPKG